MLKYQEERLRYLSTVMNKEDILLLAEYRNEFLSLYEIPEIVQAIQEVNTEDDDLIDVCVSDSVRLDTTASISLDLTTEEDNHNE